MSNVMAAAAAVDSLGIYPESPMDPEDVMYSCKDCGEILEEGKAFELAGNRWHIDCFRCNTCGTLLDSDANLLLLGDGSLICNNCTYSCNACGNKIEDLAILTGDQAFCASCFRCRNCKRKIENLRYARTSQGIFCMSCHESLMARRRKKSKAAARPHAPSAAGSGHAEKALPSLPPGVGPTSAFSPEVETPPSIYSDTPPAQKSPPERNDRQLRPHKDESPHDRQRDLSPLAADARQDGPTLPASTYGDSRPPNVSEDTDDGEERGFLPMAFDPNPAPGPPPSIQRKQLPRTQDLSPPTQNENRTPRDYFGKASTKTTGREAARDPARAAVRDAHRPASSRSGSTERERDQALRKDTQSHVSPHTSYQEKSRLRKASESNTPVAASPISAAHPDHKPKPQHAEVSAMRNEGFKLQEVPKSRKGSSAHINASPVDGGARDDRSIDKSAGASPVSVNSQLSGINPFDDPKRKDHGAASAAAPTKHMDGSSRGDPISTTTRKVKSPTLDSSTSEVTTGTSHKQMLAHDRKLSASSFPASFADTQSTISGADSRANNNDSQTNFRRSIDAPPPRAPSRPSVPSKSVANGDFIAPRAPPAPPAVSGHRHHDSISTMQSSDGQRSPDLRSAGLPKHSTDGSFTMEEEMARILRGENRREGGSGENSAPAVLRRVSNAVKHGRSFSDRGLNSGNKSPPNGSQIEISSPITVTGSSSISSPTSISALEQLRSQLKRAHHRIAELEAEKNGLQEKVDNSAQITSANDELRDKRNTMVVLDAQREMVVCELESMTKHLMKAKDNSQPLDLHSLKTDILRDFADSLQKVKDRMATDIEGLIHKRNELTAEIGQLIQMKDKGFQEYESVSAKNAQLIELNQQLVTNIQELYKAGAIGKPNGAAASLTSAANGLGIYHGHKSETPLSIEETEAAEPAAMVTAPQVVNIRKGQPKKFNWRKGGEKMAKNVTKGLKGMLAGDQPPPARDGHSPYGDIGLPYHQTQVVGGSDQGSITGRMASDASKAGPGFGFFGQKNPNLNLKGGLGNNMKNNSSTNLAAAAEASVLFGSELDARCEYEKRVIPSIVSRCIEEVELRGMNFEGIYRKSGGSSQVKTVQQGFEKDGSYDISDEDLDIHAVTSALKQYLRKLPTPLITHEVYDTLLDAGQIQDREKQAAALHAAIQDLPDSHRNCMEFLFHHLARVVEHESDNLMTPLNLAVVFAPTIMRPLSIDREMSDMQLQRNAVQAMLEQHHIIFDDN